MNNQLSRSLKSAQYSRQIIRLSIFRVLSKLSFSICPFIKLVFQFNIEFLSFKDHESYHDWFVLEDCSQNVYFPLQLIYYNKSEEEMKNQKIKIRLVNTKEQHNSEDVLEPRQSEKKYSQTVISDQTNQNVSEFMEMLKGFMKQSTNTKSTQSSHQYEVEARDREVIVDPPRAQNGRIQQSELKKWMTKVMNTVCSASFHYFSKNQMNFQQTKIYCSQNIFKNIVILNRNYKFTEKQFQLIDRHIKAGVLDYLCTKYPLTDSTEVNKKLEEVVHEVDNLESLSNNYFANTDIVFEYRKDGNYNDLIMRMINDLMKNMDQEKENGSTNYLEFDDFMRNIFEKVEDSDWMRGHQNSEGSSQSDLQLNKSLNNSEDAKQKIRKINEEKEKYRANVKEYNSFLIGRKIPENVSYYTDKEIENKNMSIKSPTVLRTLTKWCRQLWAKFEEKGYYSNRSFSVKVQKGGNINSLLPWMRKILDQKLQQEKIEIVNHLEGLSQNNYQMQAEIITKEINQQQGEEHIDQIEKISGKFSLKVVKNLHSYIISFLNRLIHGLMKVSKSLHVQHSMSQYSNWPTPANLLTFTVGDLMRCKCSSKEKEILKIYKEIQRISHEYPEKMKIACIKNRLKSGTNDIQIIIKFNDRILCEVQLTVKSKTSDFIKCSNMLSHYFYELKRSHFGPLTQLCNIWSSLDQKAKIFQSLLDIQQFDFTSKEHICKKDNILFELISYQKPLICNLCSHTFFHNNFLRSHGKCNSCETVICAKCRLEDQNSSTLIPTLILNKNVRKHCTKIITKSDPLPTQGVCILIESKIPKPEMFTIIKSESDGQDYILGKFNNEIYQIENISKPQLKQAFRNRYIVIEMKPNDEYPLIDKDEALKKYIVPSMIQKNFKKEKESISLMDLSLTTSECRQMLQSGTKYQKQCVKHLFLVDNELDELPFNPESYPCLQWITLSRNIMQTLSGIEKCHRLKNFIAMRSQFKSIPSELYKLGKLEELSLSSNQIEEIGDQIADLRNLTLLQLDNNQLTSISDKLCECSSLVTLKLDINKLTSLPEDIQRLTKLAELTCSSNLLTKMPESIGGLKNLIELDISKNRDITVLPDSFYLLEKLQMFDGSFTSISEFPGSWEKLTNLNTITLNNTAIRGPIDAICKLKKLKSIDFDRCYGIIIPNQIGDLVGLSSLSFNSCGIAELPSSFKNLTLLETLDLSHNHLITYDLTIFSNMTQLFSLSLEGNNSLHFPQLSNCSKLIKLNFSYNDIAEIHDEDIAGLINLEVLFIKSNRLKELPLKLLQLLKLRNINAGQNELQELFKSEQSDEVKRSSKTAWPLLKQCSLDTNRLTEFPLILLKSPELKRLQLSNNRIRVIPPDIVNLSKLEQLHMNFNKLEEIPTELAQMPMLHQVYLAHNSIDELPVFMELSTAEIHLVLNEEEKKQVKAEKDAKKLKFSTKMVFQRQYT